MRRYNQTQVFQFQTSELKCLYFFHFVKDQDTATGQKTRTKRSHVNAWFCILDGSSTVWATSPIGGGERDRTDDLLLAKQALSQLSYTPDKWWVWMDLNHRPHAYQACALTN
jgi:hypothetical protein